MYKWIQQYKNDPEQAFPRSGKLKPDEEESRKAQRKINTIFALLAMTSKEGYFAVLAGVVVATVISFFVESLFAKRANGSLNRMILNE